MTKLREGMGYQKYMELYTYARLACRSYDGGDRG